MTNQYTYNQQQHNQMHSNDLNGTQNRLNAQLKKY